MKNKFKKWTKVKLKSFQWTTKTPKNTDKAENYWQLIWTTWTMVSDELKISPAVTGEGERWLVKFDTDVKALGLYCHNQIEDSLRIALKDLEILE